MQRTREQLLLHYLNQLPWDLAMEMAEQELQCLCCFRSAVSGPESKELQGNSTSFSLLGIKVFVTSETLQYLSFGPQTVAGSSSAQVLIESLWVAF